MTTIKGAVFEKIVELFGSLAAQPIENNDMLVEWVRDLIDQDVASAADVRAYLSIPAEVEVSAFIKQTHATCYDATAMYLLLAAAGRCGIDFGDILTELNQRAFQRGADFATATDR